MTPTAIPSQIPEEIRKAIAQVDQQYQDSPVSAEDHKKITLEKFKRDVKRALPDLLANYVQIDEDDLRLINCKEITVRVVIPCLAPIEVHLLKYRYRLIMANDVHPEEYNYRVPGVTCRVQNLKLRKKARFWDYDKYEVNFDWHEKAFVTNDMDMALLIAKQRFEEFIEFDNYSLQINAVEPVYIPFIPSA